MRSAGSSTCRPGKFRRRRAEEISPLKIVPAAEVEALQAAGEICVGPETGRVLFPGAAMVARLAAGRTDFVAGEKLEPVYLRETAFVKAAPAARNY